MQTCLTCAEKYLYKSACRTLRDCRVRVERSRSLNREQAWISRPGTVEHSTPFDLFAHLVQYYVWHRPSTLGSVNVVIAVRLLDLSRGMWIRIMYHRVYMTLASYSCQYLCAMVLTSLTPVQNRFLNLFPRNSRLTSSNVRSWRLFEPPWTTWSTRLDKWMDVLSLPVGKTHSSPTYP